MIGKNTNKNTICFY